MVSVGADVREQRQHHAAADQQRRDDGQDVACALPRLGQQGQPARQRVGRDFLHLARAAARIAAPQDLSEQRDHHHREQKDRHHAQPAQVLAGQGQDDRRARRARHEGHQQRSHHAFAALRRIADGRNRRHVAAQPEQERHRHAAVQADAVKRAVDGERDARHDAHLFQRHQQQHQRNHVRHHDADQPDQAVDHRRPTTPAVDCGCHPAAQRHQPSRSLVVDPSADVEHDEENRRRTRPTLPTKPQRGLRNISSSQ